MPTESTEHRCSHLIHVGWDRHRRCTFMAKVSLDGKWYCGLHDPAAVARKAAEREAKTRIRLASNTSRWKLQDAAPAMAEALLLVVSEGYDHNRRVRDIVDAALRRAGKIP